MNRGPRRWTIYHWKQLLKLPLLVFIGAAGGLLTVAILNACPDLADRLNRWGKVTL